MQCVKTKTLKFFSKYLYLKKLITLPNLMVVKLLNEKQKQIQLSTCVAEITLCEIKMRSNVILCVLIITIYIQYKKNQHTNFPF